ncbi:MAG: hypothetical protein HND53_01165 [Proteobacteria bacterium]|nr:hypothetical protein [Pseudomonadota bacterium]NOG59082.1 hypothetical protein [Pseudomonadota bacterium]
MVDVALSKDNIAVNLVFISGLTRSGKALLCPIVSSFSNVEKVNVNFFLEQIPFLNYLNSIPDETAIYLLRTGMNMMVYDNAIGRNANFRPDDYTSIWKYRNPMEYIQRLFQPDGDRVIRQLDSKKKIIPMMIHNGLWHAEIWFQAFPLLKLIHMQRDPAEIVYSWMGKEYDEKFFSNIRSSTPTYFYDGKLYPYFASGWEEQYRECHGIDRIIHMIYRIRKYHQENYEKLDSNYKQRVLFVRHKSLLTETEKNLSIITEFLGVNPTDDTADILAQENCPRDISVEERRTKIKAIKEKASIETFELLMDMVDQFESTDLAI